MNLAERIKEFRKNLKLTQADVGEKLGIAPQNYNLLENGKTELTYSKIIKLAEIFSVSVVELLGEGASVVVVETNEASKELEEIKKENERLQREVQDLREMKEGLEVLIKAQINRLPDEELKKNALVGTTVGAILVLGSYLEFLFNELKERGFDLKNEKPKGEPPIDLPNDIPNF